MATTVGFSFDDLAQGIAIIGKAGITGSTGSDAGTSFKTMMMNLRPQTTAQVATMRELGIITKDGANAFFDANGKVKSMAEVAGILRNATTVASVDTSCLEPVMHFAGHLVRFRHDYSNPHPQTLPE